jgi:hypothetical protein
MLPLPSPRPVAGTLPMCGLALALTSEPFECNKHKAEGIAVFCVIIPKLSRFGRSLKHLTRLFATFDNDGIALVFLTSGWIRAQVRAPETLVGGVIVLLPRESGYAIEHVEFCHHSERVNLQPTVDMSNATEAKATVPETVSTM